VREDCKFESWVASKRLEHEERENSEVL